MASLLSVENLQVQFQTKKGINTAVDGVSFSIEKGRILGIVGESGCGKSVTSMSILQLLGSNARISGGSIKLDGKELVGLPEKEMCKIRGNDIAMIFQDPMTALNPTLTIGNQLMEPIMLHQNCNKKEAWTRAVDVLKRVGIAAPEKRMKEYPHQLSGGAYACCCDYVGAYISIESGCLEAVFLRAFHHSCKEGEGSFRVVGSADAVKVYYDLVSVAFAGDVDHIGAVWCCSADGVKVDASCDYLAAVMVYMVSDNLGSSRRSEEICMVMLVDLGKFLCKILEAFSTFLGFSVDFLKACFFW